MISCMRRAALALAVCLAAPVWPARAQDDKPATLDQKGVEQKVLVLLRDVTNQGVDLYNANNPAACYYVFRALLRSVREFLDHRPNLQKLIDDSLREAQTHPSMAARAYALRRAIDQVRGELMGKATDNGKPPMPTTLWERLGGEENVTKVLQDFLKASAADPKVNLSRNGKYTLDAAAVASLTKELLDMVSQASGGPYKYTGKSMKAVHEGMGITDAEFDAMAGHLKAALAKHGAKPDDIAAVLKAVDGTRKDIVESKKPDGEK